ncbi:biliverdin-producing heme oxygenase [Acinetobacter qingfengensis]|uniref:biliverdin-producing heme oxygenase n=2 Tax=Acinetobacter qingfengensis TaxID=1262585 RepID=UPI00123A1F47|nr:biliverdin-producing heme oxygenase [Acinetobacter qingfengensis]KAA8734559.1 biliverdin-producing heme oxygenase [Acinetobacter qingfengensis]
MNIQASVSTSLSQRLKTETSHEHDRMEQLMEKAQVFANRHNYAQHTLAQYYFQQDIENLYQHNEVEQIIPDLDVRGRSQAALQDLQDLGLEPQSSEIATEQVGYPEALGWIYVSEGSTLGAAFLFKEAQAKLGLSAEFGARNLAAYPEGRMRVWKRFKQALDDANFSKEDQDKVIEGALEGFARFGQLLDNLDQLK